MASKDLRTIKQVVEERPCWTEPSLRWIIFKADENGFDTCLYKFKRRVMIDLSLFDEWISTHRVVEPDLETEGMGGLSAGIA